MGDGRAVSSGGRRFFGRAGRPARAVLFVVVTLVVSGGVSVVTAAASATAPFGASHAAAPAGLPSLAAPATAASSSDPHPGTLEIDELGLGANTVDPALASYQQDEEPIMNVYQTLIAYNGSSSGSYVPVAATCVPGTAQCSEDYGSNFTGIFNGTGQPFTGTNGEPIYWTFVLDPAAHFYDPATSANWSIYPSDVLFSAARSLAFSDPFGEHPGGTLAQALLPWEGPGWDGGLHSPFNTTPYAVLSSMFVNDSAFCPPAAMDGVLGHGCITFDANANATDWPSFLAYLAPEVGLYITPCGWASASPQDAGLPGLPQTHAPDGDGSCLLPGNVTSTSDPGFQAFLNSTLTATGSTRWDAAEAASATSNASGLQTTMVGSGPYWSTVNLTSGYRLTPNPAYRQPSGCGGEPSDFAQYTGYCDPAPGRYIPNASIAWAVDPSTELAGLESGQLDYGGVQLTSGIHTLLDLEGLGKLTIIGAASLALFQQNYVLSWSPTERSSDPGFTGANNIPANFFAFTAARGLLQMSYPFAAIESNVWTSYGLRTFLPTGGPIPNGMGCYAPSTTINGCSNGYTVPWPYLANGGSVSTNASIVGSAGWWWAEGRNASSPYYDPSLANCTVGAPCLFSIQSPDYPPLIATASIWAASITSVTGGALQPDVGQSVSYPLLSTCSPALPGQSPCPIYDNGFVSTEPDPNPVERAYGLPDGFYTGTDAVSEALALPAFDNVSLCGHAEGSLANASYWANVGNSTTIPNACQGVAYSVYIWATQRADGLVAGPAGYLLYDLGETILNALNLYTWMGQSIGYAAAASWIAPSSVNTNALIGAGGDQFWFQFRYAGELTTTNETFRETGLPKAATWSVVVDGQTFVSSGRQLTVPLSRGTYTYEVVGTNLYTPASPQGALTVTSYPMIVRVKFLNTGSNVVFTERGLAKGTTWQLTVLGTTYNSSSSTKITVRLAAGSFAFAVTPEPNYKIVSGGRGIVVTTPPRTLSVKVDFSPYNAYGVTFSSQGLVNASWTVHLRLTRGTGLLAPKPGSIRSLTNASIGWTDLANGTYTYTVSARGYVASPGTFVINGDDVSVMVNFTARYLPSVGRVVPPPVPSPLSPVAVIPASRARE